MRALVLVTVACRHWSRLLVNQEIKKTPRDAARLTRLLRQPANRALSVGESGCIVGSVSGGSQKCESHGIAQPQKSEKVGKVPPYPRAVAASLLHALLP